MTELLREREELSREIEIGIQEFEETLYMDDPRLHTKVGKIMRDSLIRSTSLSVFQYSIDSIPKAEFPPVVEYRFSWSDPDPASHPMLIYLSQVISLDLLHGIARNMTRLHTDLNLGYGFSTCYITQDIIFACGGLDDKYKSAHKLCCCVEGSEFTYMPSMKLARYTHGIVHVPASHAVFIFGGLEKGFPTMHCEKWDLRECKEIADMHAARSRINPCLHDAKVYICGGGDQTIETYVPSEDYFASLSVQLPSNFDLASGGCCSVIDLNENLCIISSEFICKLKIKKEILSRVKQREKSPIWSLCPPVLWKDSVWVVGEDHAFRKISVADGDVEEERFYGYEASKCVIA